jgi:hypothetical protein
MAVKGRSKGDGHAQHGWKDDRRVPEDHGEHKPEKDGVEPGVVVRPRRQSAEAEAE